jgi:hypothetical protein
MGHGLMNVRLLEFFAEGVRCMCWDMNLVLAPLPDFGHLSKRDRSGVKSDITDYRLQIGPTKGAPGRSHLGSMGRKTSTILSRSK